MTPAPSPYPLDAARASLRAVGERVTPQRTLVLAIIEASDGHLDAAEIFARAHAVDPGISLSTVYRTLRILVARGLVCEIQITEPTGQSRFEATSRRGKHHHLICQDCGGIVEFANSELERQLIAVARQLGFSEKDLEMHLLAHCSMSPQVRVACGVRTDGSPKCR